MSAPPKEKRGSAFVGHSIPPSTSKTRRSAEGVGQKGHYRPLSKEFRHDGFNYRQITREGNVAIYAQNWNGCPDPSVCFEVIRIRREEATTFPSGRSYPAREVCPPSEAWGVDGFTLTNKEAAFAKLRELV